jgi:hypothetical protein
MTNDRQKAKDLAAQILRDSRDLEWLHPLAREFQKLAARDEHPMFKLDPETGKMERVPE